HAVKRRRRAAALDVAEDRRPGLISGPLLDLLLERVPNSPEAGMAELIDRGGARHRHGPLLRRRSLCRDDDREIPAALMAAVEQTADLVDVERLLWDQDHIGATRDA